MAYETGTSTSITDLLDKLRVFAVANGWTLNFQGARTSGSGQAVQLTKGSMACTWIAATSSNGVNDPGHYLGAYQHDAYSAGGGTENQANKSAVTYANDMTGPFIAYHFFTGTERGSDYLYVAVETTAGIFKHVGVGKLVSMGALSNGHFCFAVRWDYGNNLNIATTTHAVGFDSGEQGTRKGTSTQIRADSDALSPRWLDAYSNTGNRLGGGFRVADSTGARGFVYGPVRNSASAISGRTALIPCMVTGERPSSLFSVLGYPPGIRWVKLDFLDPGAILTLGAEQWKVFPIIRKNGGTGQVSSDTYGYAYKVA